MTGSLVLFDGKAVQLAEPEVIKPAKKRCYSCDQQVRRKCQWHRQNKRPLTTHSWQRWVMHSDGSIDQWCEACGAAWHKRPGSGKWTRAPRRPCE